MQIIKNWKYSSGPVNYSVSWRSPDLKMYSQLCKSAFFFHCFSYAKTIQNRLKNLIKRWVQQKTMKTRSLGLLFGPRGDFGLFWGSQGVPKIDQKSTPSFQIKAQFAGGMSQEAPRTNVNRFLMILEWFWSDFRVPRWSILGPSGVLFGDKPLHRETYANTGKQQQLEVNVATKLHRFIAFIASSSKQQQIAGNSSNQQQPATNTSK